MICENTLFVIQYSKCNACVQLETNFLFCNSPNQQNLKGESPMAANDVVSLDISAADPAKHFHLGCVAFLTWILNYAHIYVIVW